VRALRGPDVVQPPLDETRENGVQQRTRRCHDHAGELGRVAVRTLLEDVETRVEELERGGRAEDPDDVGRWQEESEDDLGGGLGADDLADDGKQDAEAAC